MRSRRKCYDIQIHSSGEVVSSRGSRKHRHVDCSETGHMSFDQYAKRPIISHSISLRAIGQSLEVIRAEGFTVTHKNGCHTVRSEALTPTCRWILRNRIVAEARESALTGSSVELEGGDAWLRFDAAVILRLHDQGRKQRQTEAFVGRQIKLSHLLRALGTELDVMSVTTFTLEWSPHSVYVDYRTADGDSGRKFFTVEQLWQVNQCNQQIDKSSSFMLMQPNELPNRDEG
jgi:hypothetical protein